MLAPFSRNKANYIQSKCGFGNTDKRVVCKRLLKLAAGFKANIRNPACGICAASKAVMSQPHYSPKAGVD